MIASSLFKDKTCFILGLGRSGCSVAKSLLKVGANVLAWDDQETVRKSAQDQGIPLANPNIINWKTIHHFILSPGIPHLYPAPHALVLQAQEAGLKPINDLEILYLSQPQARYMGITGTNGKSTTTSLIGHILRMNSRLTEIGGNLGIPVMDLEPLGTEGYYVLEVSSYQLETLGTFRFNISVILNITQDHIERHGGIEGYIKAKELIYKNSTPEDILVINVDDPPCLKIYEDLKASGKLRLVPFSMEQELEENIYIKEGILYEKLQPKFDLKQFEGLKGLHNWQNVAAAYGALRSNGMSPECIERGMASFPGLAHRQQMIAHHKNVFFINDSKATNAEAVEKAFLCYKDSSIYWLLGGQPKKGGITNLIPYFSGIKHAFLYGEAIHSFLPILKGRVPYNLCETLEEAVEKSASLAFMEKMDNAVILLSPACASFDQFLDFEARGHAFCEAVKKAIGVEKNNNQGKICFL